MMYNNSRTCGGNVQFPYLRSVSCQKKCPPSLPSTLSAARKRATALAASGKAPGVSFLEQAHPTIIVVVVVILPAFERQVPGSRWGSEKWRC